MKSQETREMGRFQKLEDLQIWHRSVDLAVALCSQPFAKLPGGHRALEDQLHRSAISVPSNIAEGWGRGTAGDFRRHLDIALGSLAELFTQLHLAEKMALLDAATASSSRDECSQIRRMILAFRHGLSSADPKGLVREATREYDPRDHEGTDLDGV